jgi:serine protease
MSTSRTFPLVVLSGAVALVFLAPVEPNVAVAGDAVEPALDSHLAVDFIDGTDLDAIRAAADAAGVKLTYASAVSEDEALFVTEAADPAAALASLRASGIVEVAEPIVRMSVSDVPKPGPTFGYPDDPYFDKQWNLDAIGAQTGWRAGGGEGVIVAVIDTGVSALPDLPAARILEGRSFVPGAATAADDHGHGTHVAGTIAQATHNGVGTAGVAPNARILPLKVLGASGMGDSSWIAAAIDEAVDQHAQVINLSLGGGHSALIVNAVEKARAAGVVVVAAAGNTGREGIGSPADASAALGVSAVGPGDALAPYSSWGKGVELAAPGGDTSVPGGGIVQGSIPSAGAYPEWQGTSMASPHVAGAAAVLFGAGAQSADEVERYLKAAAVAKDDPLKYGAGRLDIGASVRRMLIARQGVLFVVGALLALGLGLMGTLRPFGRGVAVLVGAVVAGGLFFLPLLPLPPNAWTTFLARPVLAWPGPFWSGFPLWQSCLVPLGFTFILGPTRLLGPVVLGLCAGFGAFLLYGSATGGTDLWWMPLGIDRAWLAINGTISLLAGMGVAGMQKMARKA